MPKNTKTIFMICFNTIKQHRTKNRKKHNTNNKQAITVISIIITVKIQHNVLCLFPQQYVDREIMLIFHLGALTLSQMLYHHTYCLMEKNNVR